MAEFPQVTDSTFEEEVPTLEDLVQEYDGRLKVFKLNVDVNPVTAAKYGIFSIPSVLLFKGGQVSTQIVGAVPKRHFVEKLDPFL
jgi:thioredoxin 1